MDSTNFSTQVDILKGTHSNLHVQVILESQLTSIILDKFLANVVNNAIGLAPAYGSKCVISRLAISSASHVFVIQLSSSKKSCSRRSKTRGTSQASSGRNLLQQHIFCNPSFKKYAFKMDRLAAALHSDLGVRITHGIDLLSLSRQAARDSLAAYLFAMGGVTILNKPAVSNMFQQEESTNAPIKTTAVLAWMACISASQPHMQKQLAKLPIINTSGMERRLLDVLAKTIRHADRLITLKPVKVKNEIDPKYNHKSGTVVLSSSRFKTRIMRTENLQFIQIETKGNGRASVVTGRALRVSGRAATLSVNQPIAGKIQSVTTIGREPLTSAESLRQEVMLHAMQQTSAILKHPFFKKIWLPSASPSWAMAAALKSRVPLHSSRNLNDSQTKAINAILSDRHNDRVVVIHGPPGTGKTTVIAAAVTSVMACLDDSSRTLWLVAQSNVAVKNIAEKLASVDYFNFKLLVSKDFHFDWHEHLYEKIQENLIRSDDFVGDLVAAQRLLLGSRVILCTLSMLSNKRIGAFVCLVPPQTIIFDEASQIEVGNYVPVLHRFSRTVSKLVFIGDDKQLAPYGQSNITDLKSIFELPHLRGREVFLDMQYRMPRPIGDFISAKVYGNKLKTTHAITSPESCRFIDVSNGREQQKGQSWINEREIDVVIALARNMTRLDKKFRIITPYDAQRSILENALKVAKLPWEDKCFNIDAFQGNEEDYIIVSLVRSEKIGFLKEMRRVNVMLTRCRKGMVICTNRSFITNEASDSLVGELAMTFGEEAWVPSTQVLRGSWSLLV